MRKYILLISLFCLSLFSCKKFLDLKQDKKLVVPSTLNDLQSLLDNVQFLNTGTPSAGEIASDDIYIDYTTWASLTNVTAKNAYIWNEDVFNDADDNDWTDSYQTVLYANLALEGIEKIFPAVNEKEMYNNIKGSALFYRAYAFFNLAQEFVDRIHLHRIQIPVFHYDFIQI